MKRGCPPGRHYCCGKGGACADGQYLDLRCNSRHPSTKDLSCGRLKGHTGSHAGHAFSIVETKEWS